MKKDERNIANIFFPQAQATQDSELKEGLLVGFNFEGFVFVIVSVVPLEAISGQGHLPSQLGQIIRESKFTAFDQHCAGELIILGVIEHADSTSGLSLHRQVLEYKANQNIWLNIQISDHSSDANLVLKDLIVCEYKYNVIPHFIFYPRLEKGQFISLNTVGFGNLIERCSAWDKRSPIFDRNEITMVDDLTHNDVVIRQINAASILKRLLSDRLTR